ncbi:MAG TPA: lytic transglycosylase domain-containing protein [Methylocella sp.]|nr:lytic transglycosylase domain-containing protein [Methylocella sp.]
MLRPTLSFLATFWTLSAANAGGFERPTTFDEIIARQAKIHGVPASLVHRTILRESRYNPQVVHNHCFGLMQIKLRTARSMGYQGEPFGLLDPQTNLTYAIPYLANAYHLADGDEDKATALYRGGYFYLAKRLHMGGQLRTASSAPEATQPAVASDTTTQEPSPLSQVLSLLVPPAEAAPAAGVEQAQNQSTEVPPAQSAVPPPQ